MKHRATPDQLPATYEMSAQQRWGHTIAGAGLLGVVAGGAALVATDHLDLSHTIAAIAPDHVRPSNALSDTLDLTITAGAYAGVFALGSRGVKHLRLATSEQERASYAIAHARERNQKTTIRRLGAQVGFLAVGTALIAGNYADIAHAAGSSQSTVSQQFGEALDAAMNTSGDDFTITSSPQPELSNSASLPAGVNITRILHFAEQEGVGVVPARWEWHAAHTADMGQNDKQQVIAFGLPSELTKLPSAAEDCSDVSVAAPKELGVAEGDSFSIDGLDVTVRQVLSGASGAGLLPILMNNEDFARCLQQNPNQPYSMLLAKGDREAVQRLLQDEKNAAGAVPERLFVVPLEQFQQNTQQTGENEAYPYVLQAIAEGLLLGAAALSGRANSKIIENRRINTVAEANGTTKRQLAKREAELAGSQAVKSAVLATPIVLLADAYTNSGIPGADIGPDVTTVLFVIGTTWAANRIGTAIAMRREAPKIDVSKGHSL